MDITRDEFYRAISDLKADVRQDLQGITRHLETLNGRTGKGEVADAEVRVRVTTLEEEAKRHRQRRSVDAGEGATWAAAAVTKREGYLIGLGLTILVAVLKVLEVAGTKLVHLLSTKP